jgi:hypothetical protein
MKSMSTLSRKSGRNSNRLLPAALAVLLLAACSGGSKELRVYPLQYQQLDPAAMQLVFEQRSGIRLSLAQPTAGMSALQALAENQADLTLVENSTPFVHGVRAVMPVYKSVLHLLARDDFLSADPDRPLLDASIHIANGSRAGHTFLELALRRQELGPEDYQLDAVLIPGETDLLIYFGPVNPDLHSWYQPGYRLLSLDNTLSPTSEFYQQGIEFVLPQMDPMILPPRTYQIPGNEGPIHTLSVDTLLVTRKDVPEQLIYELAKTLIEQKPRFTAIAPKLFKNISEDFDPMELNFPLHRGVRRYLNRDEPGLLERYAETINMLVYLVFLLLTGLVGFSRWRAQRKKDRIDTFYTRVLAIAERTAGEDHSLLAAELDALEREAFQSLIAEKLAADESFRIFTDILARTRSSLKQ